MIVQLDSENADLDLTSEVLCLTDTPDASHPMECQAVAYLGDGAKDLDGSGGAFTIKVTLGAQVGPVKTITLAGVTRGYLMTDSFVVPANTEVKVYVYSPNAADSDVDVTAYLFSLCQTDMIAVSGDTTGATKMRKYWNETESGTAQGGSTADITLAAGASATNDFYIGDLIFIVANTGEGQARQIQSYNGSSKVAVVNTNWAIQPDATSEYLIVPHDWTLAVVAQMQDDVLTSAVYDESTAFPLKSADSGSTEVARTGADGDTLETLSDQIDGTAVPGSAMTLADDAITSDKYDESTAYPLKSADTGSTAVARTGADGDTLEDLSDEIDALDTDVEEEITGVVPVEYDETGPQERYGSAT